jgi:Xaa-Pro aminopeptidase
LGWLTGFSGSAGEAVILANKAAIFVDGRYTLQVRDQVDLDLLTPLSIPQDKPGQWAAENLPQAGKLAYDPWLLTVKSAETYRTALAAAGKSLVPLEANPIDAVWQDQPSSPAKPVEAQPLQFAGQSVDDKLKAIAAGLKQRKADAHVLTQTDAVAWAFNIRGSDIAHTPVPLAFAIVHANGTADLVIGADRVTET